MSTEATTEQTQTAPATPEQPAAATPDPAPAPAPVQLSPKGAEAMRALMQKEAEIRQKAEELKGREAQIRAEVEQHVREQFKKDPLGALEKEGLSIAELTKRQIEARKGQDPLAPVKTELQQLRDQLARREAQEEEQRRTAALSEVQAEVRSYLDKSEEFPLVKAAGAQDVVFQEMLGHWQRTGEAMDEKTAAAQVESRLKDLAAKLTAFVGKSSEDTREVKQQAPTLTNSQSTTNHTRVAPGPLSEQEEMAAMVRALKLVER